MPTSALAGTSCTARRGDVGIAPYDFYESTMRKIKMGRAIKTRPICYALTRSDMYSD